MGRSPDRDARETRSLVLQAATDLFLQKGASASLDEVAALAGLSKGGVKYHFNSKEELIAAVAQFQVDAFRSHVAAQVNDEDIYPGQLARAYIKACIDTDNQAGIRRARHFIFVLLSSCPSVREIWQQDELRWQKAMEADGLDPEMRDTVLTAAEGVAAAPSWAYPTERARNLKRHLLKLITPGAPSMP